MPNKIMFKTNNSCLLIHNDNIYVRTVDNSDFSSRALTVIPGFQLELGRDINDYKEAMKFSRVPLFFKLVTSRTVNGDNFDYYLLVRMKTGRVEDKVVANIICKSGILTSISFNRKLIRDGDYRRYNQLSVLHQLIVPKDLNGTSNRTEQLKKILGGVIFCTDGINVIEKNSNLIAITKVGGLSLKYTFIKDVNNSNYVLVSISLAEQGEK